MENNGEEAVWRGKISKEIQKKNYYGNSGPPSSSPQGMEYFRADLTMEYASNPPYRCN